MSIKRRAAAVIEFIANLKAQKLLSGLLKKDTQKAKLFVNKHGWRSSKDEALKKYKRIGWEWKMNYFVCQGRIKCAEKKDWTPRKKEEWKYWNSVELW